MPLEPDGPPPTSRCAERGASPWHLRELASDAAASSRAFEAARLLQAAAPISAASPSTSGPTRTRTTSLGHRFLLCFHDAPLRPTTRPERRRWPRGSSSWSCRSPSRHRRARLRRRCSARLGRHETAREAPQSGHAPARCVARLAHRAFGVRRALLCLRRRAARLAGRAGQEHAQPACKAAQSLASAKSSPASVQFRYIEPHVRLPCVNEPNVHWPFVAECGFRRRGA